MQSLTIPAEFNQFRATSLNVTFKSCRLQYERLPLHIETGYGCINLEGDLTLSRSYFQYCCALLTLQITNLK